ncbi:multicopper oxidase PcoA [soil metagenome]
MRAIHLASLSLWLLVAAAPTMAQARTVSYDLVLAKTPGPDVNGQKAMTINGTLPGPTLRFTDGDNAVLRVRNDLGEPTSIHWHGLLVPNDQDGVPHVTMAPIAVGETRVYRFRLRQSGTFWYHSHSGLQEQLGIYGSIVITPRGGERIKTDRDVVAVLSDWTDENPFDVLTQLRAGREWQGIKKGTAQSWLGAAQAGELKSFFMRSLTRMPPMDLSDVAYRHFLVNGQPVSSLEARAGETVRVRLVNASTVTYYFIEFAGGPVKIISADGGDVQPVSTGRFLISAAETYDLLVKVPSGGAYELRATAQDGSGQSSFFIGKGERHAAPDVPRANLYASMSMKDMAGMNGGASTKPMSGMDHSSMPMPGEGDGPEKDAGAMKKNGMAGMKGMDHSAMKMPMDEGAKPKAEPAVTNHESMAGMKDMPGMDQGSKGKPMKGMDGAAMSNGMTSAERPGSPYELLSAVHSTRLTHDRPLREYTFRLQGDMVRFVWTLDGKTLSEADTINVRRGERVRFNFINETMMHHPMHLHGHFFRVLTSAGDYSPLKHTVDVPPMETRIIEFAADEPGDWFMHCHVLYHMAVGMARVIHYEDAPPNPSFHDMKGGLGNEHDPIFFFGAGTALSQMSDGFITLQNNRNGLAASWEVGWENVEKTEYEVDLTYDRYLNTFTSVFAGAQLANNEAGDRGIAGVRYLLPFLVQSQVWVDTSGDFRFSLRESIPLTSRLGVYGGIEYDTLTHWEGIAGVEYVLGKRLSLIGQWHSEYGLGGGVLIRF